MDKSEKINDIIKATESKTYLEIGYGNGHNFDRIKCGKKFAVDPNIEKPSKNKLKITSDEFFEDTEKDFDVVFIDGDHTAEQSRNDVLNALKCDPKAIILHDTIPKSKEMQEVPRKQNVWTGDVWRSAIGFIDSYPDVKVETFKADYGLTVIYPDGKRARKHFEDTETSYEDFQKNAKELLKIID